MYAAAVLVQSGSLLLLHMNRTDGTAAMETEANQQNTTALERVWQCGTDCTESWVPAAVLVWNDTSVETPSWPIAHAAAVVGRCRNGSGSGQSG